MMVTRNNRKTAGRVIAAAVLLGAFLPGCGGRDSFVLLNLQVHFQGFLEPTPGKVTLVEGLPAQTSTGGSVFVDVVVTDTEGIFGVDFDLLYDSSHFALDGGDPGDFLNEGGTVPTQLQIETVPVSPTMTRIIVGHYRFEVTTGDIPAVGPQVLLSLEFRPRSSEPVTSLLVFDDSERFPRVQSADGTVVVGPEDFHGGELFLELTP